MKVITCSHKNKNCKECRLDNSDYESVVNAVQSGGLAVYPTDTLYGIAADPFNDTAVKKVFIVKNRPFDMPLSVAVADLRMLESVAVINDYAKTIIEKFLPGPITVLLTKKPSISDLLTSGENQIGIRIPNHPFALKFIKKVGPITSTSANIHSHKNPVDIKMAEEDLGEMVDIYVDCGKTRFAAPSTIVDISEDEVEIVRAGIISKEEIENALSKR